MEFKDVGRLEFWDSRPFYESANILVAADEPILALRVLKSVPGYYRDNRPSDLVELERRIHEMIATPNFYSQSVVDTKIDAQRAKAAIDGTARGQLIRRDVEAYNKDGKKPHITDLGPGEYWLVHGLHDMGLDFTYKAIGLCDKADAQARAKIPQRFQDEAHASQPQIFVACEIIEHLHYEGEIAAEYHRNRVRADIIHMSTPKYTFNPFMSQLNWYENKTDLGHLRTYTPNEFAETVIKMFPNFEWNMHDDVILHLKGVKK